MFFIYINYLMYSLLIISRCEVNELTLNTSKTTKFWYFTGVSLSLF